MYFFNNKRPDRLGNATKRITVLPPWPTRTQTQMSLQTVFVHPNLLRARLSNKPAFPLPQNLLCGFASDCVNPLLYARDERRHRLPVIARVCKSAPVFGLIASWGECGATRADGGILGGMTTGRGTPFPPPVWGRPKTTPLNGHDDSLQRY